MWNTPTYPRLSQIPRLYKTEKVPIKEKLVYLHLFLGGCDWYVCEFDGSDILWGFAILNGDFLNAEWGYFSFQELKAIQVYGGIEVDCELEEHWGIRPSSNVEKISQAQGWR